jgi:hypothetical protein
MVRLDNEPAKQRERSMRYGLIFTGVLMAAAAGATGVAAAPALEPHFTNTASLVQPAGYWNRQYRYYGPYAVPPAAVVVPQPAPVVPVVPPAVVEQPVIVVPPPRPASCGEYRYWNGQYCVDARYNRPYLGPRP